MSCIRTLVWRRRHDPTHQTDELALPSLLDDEQPKRKKKNQIICNAWRLIYTYNHSWSLYIPTHPVPAQTHPYCMDTGHCG